MPQLAGTEIRVLRAVAQLNAAEPLIIGRKLGLSSHYAEYLCNYLTRSGYLTQSGRKFRPTPKGQEVAERKAELERTVRELAE